MNSLTHKVSEVSELVYTFASHDSRIEVVRNAVAVMDEESAAIMDAMIALGHIGTQNGYITAP